MYWSGGAGGLRANIALGKGSGATSPHLTALEDGVGVAGGHGARLGIGKQDIRHE